MHPHVIMTGDILKRLRLARDLQSCKMLEKKRKIGQKMITPANVLFYFLFIYLFIIIIYLFIYFLWLCYVFMLSLSGV